MDNMTMPKEIDKPHHIFINLYKPDIFQKFLEGFLLFLQENLSNREVIGQNYSYQFFTRGQPHDPRNPDWKPFKLVHEYCKRTGDHFGVAKDLIEDRLGRRLKGYI